MVTDVQGSRYELVADNDHNNAHTIFRNISDTKLYKPYQHPPKVSAPTQSRHKYSSLNNTPVNPAFNDTASPYTAPFSPDYTPYNRIATIPISRPPNTNTQQTRERGGHNKWNTTQPAKYADFVGDELKTQIKIWEWCCIRSYLPYTESFPRVSWKRD